MSNDIELLEFGRQNILFPNKVAMRFHSLVVFNRLSGDRIYSKVGVHHQNTHVISLSGIY